MFDAYEWDAAKDERNRIKHGIDFDTAIHIFGGDCLVRQGRPVGEEARFVAIGMVQGFEIAVVFTRRPGNVCRVISARRARHGERRAYRAAFGGGNA